MALVDEVQGRYSSELLIQASNPQNSAATSLDTTRLGYAVTDVQAEFTKRGITYDNSIATHVATAVPGVYARLLIVTGQGGQELWKQFIEDMNILTTSTSRDRIKASTDSLLSPTTDTLGDLPASDRKSFRSYVPNAPGRGPLSGPTDSNQS